MSWRGLPLWRGGGARTAASAWAGGRVRPRALPLWLACGLTPWRGWGRMGARGRAQLLEYAIGAVWKACQNCEANRAVVRAHGIRAIEALSHDDSLSPEISRSRASFTHPLPPHIPLPHIPSSPRCPGRGPLPQTRSVCSDPLRVLLHMLIGTWCLLRRQLLVPRGALLSWWSRAVLYSWCPLWWRTGVWGPVVPVFHGGV